MTLRSAVVIPNWNGMDFLEECLAALRKQSQPHTAIVVDNGSTDDSKQFVDSHYPEVHLICLDVNQGFAGGVNRGIEYALNQGFDFVALLNNDAVAHEEWLKNLVKTIQTDSRIGIVTSKMLRQGSNILHSTGDLYSIWAMPFPRGIDEVDSGQYDDPSQREVFSGSGGASLYRAEMLDRIGLFDEDYFAYYEDVDISFRAQMENWRVRYEPRAIVHHFVGGTSSKISGFTHYHAVKNLHLLYWRNMPLTLLLKYLPRYLVSMGLVLAGDIRRGQLPINLRASRKVLSLMPKTLHLRAKMKGRRTVSTSHIDALLYREPPSVGFPKLRLRRSSRA